MFSISGPDLTLVFDRAGSEEMRFSFLSHQPVRNVHVQHFETRSDTGVRSGTNVAERRVAQGLFAKHLRVLRCGAVLHCDPRQRWPHRLKEIVLLHPSSGLSPDQYLALAAHRRPVSWSGSSDRTTASSAQLTLVVRFATLNVVSVTPYRAADSLSKLVRAQLLWDAFPEE